MPLPPCRPAELGEVSIYVWINNRVGIPYRTFMIALISFSSWGCSFRVSCSAQCCAVLCRVQESLRDLVGMLCVWLVFSDGLCNSLADSVCLWHYAGALRSKYGDLFGIGRSAWVPALAREKYIRADKMVLILTSSNETRLASRSETLRRLRKQEKADAAKHPSRCHQELTKIITMRKMENRFIVKCC